MATRSPVCTRRCRALAALILEPGVGEGSGCRPRARRPSGRRSLCAPPLDVAVAALRDEPLREGRVVPVEDAVPALVPVDERRSACSFQKATVGGCVLVGVGLDVGRGCEVCGGLEPLSSSPSGSSFRRHSPRAVEIGLHRGQMLLRHAQQIDALATGQLDHRDLVLLGHVGDLAQLSHSSPRPSSAGPPRTCRRAGCWRARDR